MVVKNRKLIILGVQLMSPYFKKEVFLPKKPLF
jgi:hypothetical protein